MKTAKRDIILESIIKEYIKSKSPIGSSELHDKMSLRISPSTIRIYLKQLSDEGSLIQLHVSSGRVPTQIALENYWINKIEPEIPLEVKDMEKIQDSIQEYGIYCILKKSKSSVLNEVMCANKRFLILVFDDAEVILKYHQKVESFLKDFIGCSMKDLRNIASSVGLYELHNKLNDIFLKEALLEEGVNELYNIANELNDNDFVQRIISPSFLDSLRVGVYFDDFVPQGCMAIKHNALVNHEASQIFCFGRLDSDFEGFLNNGLKE